MPLPLIGGITAGKALLAGGTALAGLDLLGRGKDLIADDRAEAKRELTADALELQAAVTPELLLGTQPTQVTPVSYEGVRQSQAQDLANLIEVSSGQLSEIRKRSIPSPAELAGRVGVRLR